MVKAYKDVFEHAFAEDSNMRLYEVRMACTGGRERAYAVTAQHTSS